MEKRRVAPEPMFACSQRITDGPVVVITQTLACLRRQCRTQNYRGRAIHVLSGTIWKSLRYCSRIVWRDHRDLLPVLPDALLLRCKSPCFCKPSLRETPKESADIKSTQLRHHILKNNMDRVLAKPADICCIKGHFHTGEPTGSIEQIGGTDTYVAEPDAATSNGNVLLFFPDAFGLHINSFLMMDAFAACGYLTLGVDYFLGVCKPVRVTTKRQLITTVSGCSWETHCDTTYGSQLRFRGLEKQALEAHRRGGR